MLGARRRGRPGLGGAIRSTWTTCSGAIHSCLALRALRRQVLSLAVRGLRGEGLAVLGLRGEGRRGPIRGRGVRDPPHVARVRWSHVQAERWVFVPHQGHVGDHAIDPAVQPQHQVKEAPPVLPGEEQDDPGDEHQQSQERESDALLHPNAVALYPGPRRPRQHGDDEQLGNGRPNWMRAGDTPVATLAVFNQTSGPQTVEVELTGQGTSGVSRAGSVRR